MQTLSPASLRPPRTGWMRGTLNEARLDLTVDRQAGRVQGTCNNLPVQIATDADQGHTSGTANGQDVELNVQWSPDRVVQSGTANGSDWSSDLDVSGGSLQGSNVDLAVDFQNGTVHGTAFDSPLSLRLDAASGALRGTMNGKTVDATLTNLDLTDFLQNAFVFAPTTPVQATLTHLLRQQPPAA